MELAEGETLAERIAAGPLPLGEALAIARQIGEALEEAHEKGIVHRDLKPANVKVSSDGKVKLLDFGLAKAWAAEPASGVSSEEEAALARRRTDQTTPGAVVGTVSYMAPEQARGRPVDKRADIWAFGVVLFEMLTGQRLFARETPSDVVVAVLTHEPDWSLLPEGTPAGVRRLLRRCLTRDARNRLHDIADARLELSDAEVSAARPRPRPLRQRPPRCVPRHDRGGHGPAARPSSRRSSSRPRPGRLSSRRAGREPSLRSSGTSPGRTETSSRRA